MLSRTEWLVVALALLFCPGFSWSADPETLFERLDRNRDGYLSPAELDVPEARNSNWIAIDRDRDGRISRREFSTMVAQPERQVPASAAVGGTSPTSGSSSAPKPSRQE